MSSRRTALLALTALPFGATLGLAPRPARAQVRDLADAVDKAGRQRMLSQRLVKAWIALAQGIEPERAQRVLDESLARFDRQLTELQAFAGTPAIRATYTELDAVWRAFKTALVGRAPELNALPGLLALDARTLALAHQGTQQLEALSSRPTGTLINLAGRQRMLSQRMAKFRLAGALPRLASESREQVRAAATEFVTALDRLEQAPQATPAILDELQLARGQWVFFQQALQRPGAPAGRDATELFVSSEHLLQVMDRVTLLYARQGA